MSTAEEMEAGRKRSEYFANLGASRTDPKSEPTDESSGVTPKKNDDASNGIPFGSTGYTGAHGGGGSEPTGNTGLRTNVIPLGPSGNWSTESGGTGPIGKTAPIGNTGPTGTQPGPNASQAKQSQQLGPDAGLTKESDASAHRSETLRAAEGYIRACCHVSPGIRRDKKPKKGWSWTKDKLALADASKYFDKDRHNVLVTLGKASNDLVDIDLDWIEATAAADLLMHELPSFGRSGKPRSHRLAICGDIKTRKYFLPQSLANHPKVGGEHAMCIAEIRGNGAYTVFPGSEHETGQRVEWTDANADNMTAIHAVDATTLPKTMGLLSLLRSA